MVSNVMQSRLQSHAGLCRHQNVLRPSQCSTSSNCANWPWTVVQHRVTPAVQAVSSSEAQPAEQPKKQQQQQQQQQWTYKYKWQPCPTLCARDDKHCYEVEALIQNVLSFPNLPSRIHRALPSLTANLHSMTALVEQMAGHFGKELTLYYIRKQPRLLDMDFQTVLQRCNDIQEVAGVRDVEIPQLLRKCPGVLLLPRQELQQRYENIPRIIHFNSVQTRALIIKYPSVLLGSSNYVKGCVDRFRQLCYTREEWARDFDTISPSLLAYFLRDAGDQLMRLEYLASTGERPEWMLRDIMKPANRTFRSKLRNYTQWELRVKQRRTQQRAAAAAAAQQAAQQAEAAAIKAAILTAVDGGEPDSSSSSLGQQPGPQQQPPPQ